MCAGRLASDSPRLPPSFSCIAGYSIRVILACMFIQYVYTLSFLRLWRRWLMGQALLFIVEFILDFSFGVTPRSQVNPPLAWPSFLLVFCCCLGFVWFAYIIISFRLTRYECLYSISTRVHNIVQVLITVHVILKFNCQTTYSCFR